MAQEGWAVKAKIAKDEYGVEIMKQEQMRSE
jgi:hypothetical protein